MTKCKAAKNCPDNLWNNSNGILTYKPVITDECRFATCAAKSAIKILILIVPTCRQIHARKREVGGAQRWTQLFVALEENVVV